MAKSYSLILLLLFSACTHSIKLEPKYDSQNHLEEDEGYANGKYVTAASYQSVIPTLAHTKLVFIGEKTKSEVKLDLNAGGDSFSFKAPADDYQLVGLGSQAAVDSPSKIRITIRTGETTAIGTLFSSCSNWDNRESSNQVFRDFILKKQYQAFQLFRANQEWDECLLFLSP